jgi:general secretion pathway protein B
MSYILDALTRSEQERNRGTVPELHTVQAPFPRSETASGLRARYLVAGVLLAGVGAAAGWLHSYDAGGGNAATAQTEPAALQRPQVVAAVATPSIRAPSDKLAEPAPVPPLSVAPAEDPAPPARVAPKPKKEKPTQKAPEATRPRNERVLPSEPSAALQAELPKLEVTGFADSRDTGRMALINGRVVVEGDEFAGLTVEQIAPGSVTLRYKGHRFRQSY